MPKKPDSGPKEPNLELPSFGFRRRRRAAPEEEPEAPAEPAAQEPGVDEPEHAPDGERDLPATTVENAPETPVARAAASVPSAPAAEVVVEEPAPEAEDAGPAGDVTPDARRERTGPSPLTRMPGSFAAVGAGLVCGLIGTVLSVGSLRGCEAVRGVGTCGGIGLFALLAILVVEIFIGAAILKGCSVKDSFSTSFLGVGVAAVVIVLFLLSYLGSWWMLVVVPLVTAAAYLFSWWVTTRFVDVRDDDRHR